MNTTIPSHLELHNDPWDLVDPVRRRLLEQSWAGVCRRHLGPHLPGEALTAYFTTTGGRPRTSPRFMLGPLILQQLHDLTDAQTVAAIACNLAGHYAVDIPPYSEMDICERTLRTYRQGVRHNRLAELLFRHLTAVLLQDFHLDTSPQRIDATAVRSAIRKLRR